MGTLKTGLPNVLFGSVDTHAVWKEFVEDFAFVHCVGVRCLEGKKKKTMCSPLRAREEFLTIDQRTD